MLVHGSVPKDMLVSTIIPIPKGKNANQSVSANYRGIALSSIFGKIVDLIVLNRYADKLCTSQLQFGFKAKRSTSMCTMLMKESIAYYINNDSSVYCTLLDATKAFDRVQYCKMFRLLLEKGLPPICIRLIMNMYTNHSARIAWNGICSPPFSVKNGVKQGGVLSPVLFCVYLDGLLHSLTAANYGCSIGGIFVRALAYADDFSCWP